MQINEDYDQVYADLGEAYQIFGESSTWGRALCRVLSTKLYQQSSQFDFTKIVIALDNAIFRLHEVRHLKAVHLTQMILA